MAEIQDIKKALQPNKPSVERGNTPLSFLIREGRVIKAAPFAFMGCVLIAIAGLVLAFNFLYGVQMENYKSTIGRQDNELRDWQTKLGAQTPDEARDKWGAGPGAQKVIDDLQKRVDNLSAELRGVKWDSLDEGTIKAIAEALKEVPSRKAAVNFVDKNSWPLVASIETAFKLAEWPMPYEPDAVVGWHKDGIWIGPQDEDTERIKKIIEEKTGLEVKFFPYRRLFFGPKEVNILVGYKPK